jgi:hypothetical protein
MAKCRVTFIEETYPLALLWNSRGRVINSIRYPKGTKLTPQRKVRARHLLCSDYERAKRRRRGR